MTARPRRSETHPFNRFLATPEPAPIVPARRGRKARRTRRREAAHVGEVDERGAFGVLYDAVTGRSASEKPPQARVPETEAKRQRRKLARRAEPAGERPVSGRRRPAGR